MRAGITVIVASGLLLASCTVAPTPTDNKSLNLDDGIVLSIFDQDALVGRAEPAASLVGGLFPEPPFGIGEHYERLQDDRLGLAWSQAECEKAPELHLDLEDGVVIANLYRGTRADSERPCPLVSIVKGVVIDLSTRATDVQFHVHEGSP